MRTAVTNQGKRDDKSTVDVICGLGGGWFLALRGKESGMKADLHHPGGGTCREGEQSQRKRGLCSMNSKSHFIGFVPGGS